MANLLLPHKNLLHQRFFQTDLAQLYVEIPFEELSKQITASKQNISGRGLKSWFDFKGAMGLRY